MSLTFDAPGRSFELTHPDRVMFPEIGLTKRELVDYYARVAETAAPLWKGRAVTMQRFPEGIDGEGFFQKHASDWFPDWIATKTLPKEGGNVEYVVADDPATFAWLAAHGCVTPHLTLARVDRPDHPDRMIFDLDPSDGDLEKVRAAARLVKEVFDRLEAPSFVQTTGSRGFHVVVQLDRSAGFDAARTLAQCLARRIAEAAPDLATVEQRKSKRGDRVYLDVMRNSYGQTAVAPYAVRALPEAPVATPLDWDEAMGGAGPRDWTVRNLFRRLDRKADPWARIDAAPVSVADLAARAGKLD